MVCVRLEVQAALLRQRTIQLKGQTLPGKRSILEAAVAAVQKAAAAVRRRLEETVHLALLALEQTEVRQELEAGRAAQAAAVRLVDRMELVT
jgi:hypothetical protein